MVRKGVYTALSEVPAYKDSLEHIVDELALLDLRLRVAVSIFRDSDELEDWKSHTGLYISDREIDSSLQEEGKQSGKRKIAQTYLAKSKAQIAEMETMIARKKEQSIKNGVLLNLDRLSRYLNLSAFETSILIICMAPEIDSKYEKIYAYLQDDLSKKKPTLRLIFDLLCDSIADKVRSRIFFTSRSKLLLFRILGFYNSQEGVDNNRSNVARRIPTTSLLAIPLWMDQHIINFILGSEEIDSRLESFSKLVLPKKETGLRKIRDGYPRLKKKSLSIIKQWLQDCTSNGGKRIPAPVFYFYGPSGSGRKMLAQQICTELGLPLFIVDVKRAITLSRDFDETIGLSFRELLIHGNAIIYLDNFDIITRPFNNGGSGSAAVDISSNGGGDGGDEEEEEDGVEGAKSSSTKQEDVDEGLLGGNKDHHYYYNNSPTDYYLEVVLQGIETLSQNIVILAGQKALGPDALKERIYPLVIAMPPLSYSMRSDLWKVLLMQYPIQGGIDVKDLASKFNFTPGEIKNALLTASRIASLNNADKLVEYHNTTSSTNPDGYSSSILPTLSSREIYEACRLQSNKRLAHFAQHIDTKYTMEDIVLPLERKKQLQEILNYVKYRNSVYEEWGFGDKVSRGKGLNILFAGESGTGKTMAAEVIANELKLDLYKIDLSLIVSKFVGQTEKNIARIFRDFQSSNSIICIDEAEGLFSKRTQEVRQAMDRFQNMEVNFLLQKLEEHTGIVILTSNLAKNIDDAFVRRMHSWIEFPRPNNECRLKIWKNIFPISAPVDRKNVDFDFLARQFQISGGVIRNIAVASAFMAKESGASNITMNHIIKAVKREFDKMGKPCLKSDFGRFYAAVIDDVNGSTT
jgi:SpoVK/Ycf46/Vps4 family AAA+-type ATPase